MSHFKCAFKLIWTYKMNWLKNHAHESSAVITNTSECTVISYPTSDIFIQTYTLKRFGGDEQANETYICFQVKSLSQNSWSQSMRGLWARLRVYGKHVNICKKSHRHMISITLSDKCNAKISLPDQNWKQREKKIKTANIDFKLPEWRA